MKRTQLLFIGETDSSILQLLQEMDDIDTHSVKQIMQVSHRLSEFELMLADLSEVTSKRQIDRIRLQAPDLPLIVVVDRSQESMIATLSDRIEDYLLSDEVSSVLIRYAIRHARERARLMESAQLTTEHLERVIDDQKILRRIERELGYTLNIGRVLDLAMDTATRLTAASACAIGWIDEDTNHLIQLGHLGENELFSESIYLNDLTKYPQLASVLSSGKPEVETDGRYSLVMLPLIVRGKTMGVLSLERIPEGFYYDQSDWEFLIHLSNRTASAIETARSHQRTSFQAEKLDLLYDLGNTIAQHLNRGDLLDAGVAGLTRLLDCAGAMYLDFQPPTRTLSVTQLYVADDGMPPHSKIGDVIEMFDFGLLLAMLRISLLQIRRGDPTSIEDDLRFIEMLGVDSAILAPLISEDGTLKGLMVAYENRVERAFSNDEIALARSFTASVAVALRKAELFAAVQQLEQVKSEMINMVSHDLRTPLSRILLSIRLMEKRDELAPDAINDIINGIRATTEQMQILLEDILSLEQIESEDGDGWKHFNVTEILQKVTNTFADHVKLNQQQFVTELPKEAITALGSAIQIQQAFSNYISNAIKYTPKGGTVTVRAYAKDNFLIFEVEDTGFGIPTDSQKKIFNRFYRAKAPGTEKVSGTGLGLSLVKTVIERHGGRVWFSSIEGIGSTFSCSVPIKLT